MTDYTTRTMAQAPAERPPVKRWGVWLMIPLLVGTVVLCAFALEWRESLKTERIIVEGARILSMQQITSLANVASSTPMEAVNLDDVRQRILSQPFVKSVTVIRRYPNSLHLSIVERQPIASLNLGQLCYIDADGTMLPYISSQTPLDFPVISGIDGIKNPEVGHTILHSDLQSALEVLQTALALDSAIYHFISEVNMSNGGDIILYSNEVGVPINLGRGNIGKKLLTLQSFWLNFVKSNNANQLRSVDLRFDDQVVVKWQSDQQQTKSPL